MKVLYIDCGMGAAGDMLSAALLELMPDQIEALKELNGLGIPGVVFKRVTATKMGIKGGQMVVSVYDEVEGEEHHKAHEHESHHGRTLARIEETVKKMTAPQEIKNEILAIYREIADAESRVHGEAVELLHFHEVGALDAVADIAAFCYLLKKINPGKIVASPVHVGGGFVNSAHGTIPVPAPATALLLKGVPIYSTDIKGELCTPTGAALLKHFVDSFGEMPLIRTSAVGYGMGKKDFEKPNCIRMILGEEGASIKSSFAKKKEKEAAAEPEMEPNESIYELTCNIDDMTGEGLGYAMECLFNYGALDVYASPIIMKKSRSANELHVLCNKEDKDALIEAIFKLTSTIGIREKVYKRYVLDRRMEVLDTPLGEVRVKFVEGYGTKRLKYEYEDLTWIAKEKKCSLAEAGRMVDDWAKSNKKI